MWFFALLLQTHSAWAVKNFENEIERDIPLRKSLPIYLQHKTGSITIQGWVQDRVRVKMKSHVLADSEAQAKQAFDKLGLISLESLDRFEMRVGHKQGVDLVSKMKDQLQNSVQVDLEIKAPLQSDITIVLGDGKQLKIESWHGGVTILGKNNNLQFSKLSLVRPLSINCVECDTQIRDSKFGGHLFLGSKALLLSNVEATPSVSIDESNEEIRIENSRGVMSVNTKTGRMSVLKFNGNLNFQSIDGGADISGFQGNLNVQTQTGQVVVDVDSIQKQLNVDTDKSDIQLALPPQFEGALDLSSLRGEVVVQFAYELKHAGSDTYGPSSPGRIDGQIGSNASVNLHAYTKQGGVRLIRKAPAR